MTPKPNAAVAVFCLTGAILASIIAIAVVPALPQIAKEIGGGDGALAAQLVMTVPAIFMIIGASVSGYVSERIGRRAVAMICLILYSLSGASGLYWDSLAGLVGSRIILGIVGGALLTTAYATIGEYFHGRARDWVLGAVSMLSSSSSVALLWFGGGLVDSYGWRAPFALYLAGIPIFFLAWTGMHRGLPPGTSKTEAGWRPVFQLWPFYVLVASYTVGMYMCAIQAPFLFTERGETSAEVISRAIAISSISAAAASLAYGMMRKWMNFAAMFAFISAMLAIGMLLAVYIPDTQGFFVASLIMGMGMGIIEPTIASEILKRSPELLHDRAIGVNISALFLGQFLNPLVVKPLRDLGGAPFAFTAVGGAFGLAALAFLIALTMRRRTT